MIAQRSRLLRQVDRGADAGNGGIGRLVGRQPWRASASRPANSPRSSWSFASAAMARDFSGSCCQHLASRARPPRQSPACASASASARSSSIGPGPTGLRRWSMKALIWLSGTAPMKPSTGWPFLKAMTAGIDWMPSWPAICGCSSMFILTSFTLPPAGLDGLLEHGRELLAGSAPGRPEIDEHGLLSSIPSSRPAGTSRSWCRK